MATQVDVEITLNYRMSEYLTAYPIDVSYPAVTYSPVVGRPYLRVDFLHDETEQVEVGSTSDNRARGIYQITINVENNKGTGEVSTLISQLSEYFNRGTSISYNGIGVKITNFYLGGKQEDEDWYRKVVNIVFRSDIEN